MGQIEPKVDVYNPQSRQHKCFTNERAQKYVYKALKLQNNQVHFNDLLALLPEFTDQIFKKFLKEVHGIPYLDYLLNSRGR